MGPVFCFYVEICRFMSSRPHFEVTEKTIYQWIGREDLNRNHRISHVKIMGLKPFKPVNFAFSTNPLIYIFLWLSYGFPP